MPGAFCRPRSAGFQGMFKPSVVPTSACQLRALGGWR